MIHRAILAAVLAAACGGGSRNAVTLSARIGSTSRRASVQASGTELLRVRVSMGSLRVERSDSKTEVELAAGPLLVDVKGAALSGSLVRLLSTPVPAATYHKMKVSVRRVSVSPVAAFDDLVHRGASVLLEGTVDGQPFIFSSALEAELEHESTFELGATATNITINLDPSDWFKGQDGSRLDPRTETNRAAIEANIGRSFSAFEDDDESGFDPHARPEDGGRSQDGGVDDHGRPDGGNGQPDAGTAQPEPGTPAPPAPAPPAPAPPAPAQPPSAPPAPATPAPVPPAPDGGHDDHQGGDDHKGGDDHSGGDDHKDGGGGHG